MKKHLEFEYSSKLFASDGQDNDYFGYAVSMSDDYLAVSAPYKDFSDTVPNTGAVYMFKRNDDTWSQIDILTPVGEIDVEGDNFGYSVHMDEDYLIVGSPEARATGVVDIFSKKRSWGHLKKLIGSDTISGDKFGSSVSIYGRYAIVGATGSEDYNGGAKQVQSHGCRCSFCI